MALVLWWWCYKGMKTDEVCGQVWCAACRSPHWHKQQLRSWDACAGGHTAEERVWVKGDGEGGAEGAVGLVHRDSAGLGRLQSATATGCTPGGPS